jgi:3-dehydroquinate dehydratase-1
MEILDSVQMAEIRLDLNNFTDEETGRIFSHSTPTIATCRPGKTRTEDQFRQLSTAIRAGSDYVDIEIESEKKQREAIISLAKEHTCKIIVSYHNFDITPGLKELCNILDQCFLLGADIAKITTQSNSQADNARLLSLYSDGRPMVVLGMGDIGRLTRIVSPILGAAFTFAAMDNGKETAPGQITYSHMLEILSKLENALN